MAQCYHRKIAYLTDGGLKFKVPSVPYRKVSIPCGKCVACRVNNAASWATRAMHESQYCDGGCFVTLTYSPEHCPSDYCISKRDVQLFLKRLRKHLSTHGGSLRAYFAVGEYGTKFGRPHYHILLLGWSPDDLEYHSKSYSGLPVYTSKTLERIWGLGFCPVGTITSGSAAYVARYSKKLDNDSNVGNRTKPFFLASRNIPLSNGKQGALGAQWVIDNHEALRLGYVSHPSKPSVKCRIPDYYFDLLERWYPSEYEALRRLRYDYAVESNDGVFCVDSNGLPTAYFDDSLKSDDIRVWSDRLSAPRLLTEAEILDMLSTIFRDEERAQLSRLSKLRRNME